MHFIEPLLDVNGAAAVTSPFLIVVSSSKDKKLNGSFFWVSVSSIFNTATPMVALFNAPTSFEPSPHIDGFFPLFIKSLMISSFWVGDTRQNNLMYCIISCLFGMSVTSSICLYSSPVKPKVYLFANSFISSTVFVSFMKLLSKSFHFTFLSSIFNNPNWFGPNFKSFDTFEVVNKWSPVIIQTPYLALINSVIYLLTLGFKGVSTIANPQNIKSFSKSSLFVL